MTIDDARVGLSAPRAVRSKARGPWGAALARPRGLCYGPAMRGEEAKRVATPPDDDADVELVRALARGDQRALAELYDRYSPLLLAVGQRVLGGRREAEDLLHDVFLEVWRHAADFDRTRGSVRAWLLMRMRSRALDRKRADGRSRVVLADDGTLPEANDHGPAEDPALAPDRASVKKALAALPEDQRRVLELGYFEGLSSSEIAAEVNIPIGTVKSRVARGLRELRVLVAGAEGGRL